MNPIQQKNREPNHFYPNHYFQYSFQQPYRFWSAKNFFSKNIRCFFLSFIIVPDFFKLPPGGWNNSILNFSQESLDPWPMIGSDQAPNTVGFLFDLHVLFF